MHGFGILMIIFSVVLFLAGYYIYTGHNSEILLWRCYNKKTTKRRLKYIGKIVMITCISPFISGIIALLFESDNFFPIALMLFSLVFIIVLSIKYIKE